MWEKAQSAMEFLTTYGWALLIIAVVLFALYKLNIFSGGYTTTRAGTGSCFVYRPEGPWSVIQASVAGVCTGLEPQFVGSFNPGSKSTVQVNSETQLVSNTITVSAWVSPSVTNIAGQGVFGNAGSYYLSLANTGKLTWDVVVSGTDHTYTSSNVVNPNTFTFVSATYDGNYARTYINGVLESNTALTGAVSTSSTPFFVGNTPTYFSGFISNLQVYNTSLSPGDIQALYFAGIGAAPASVQNLVGWWQLNGNGNDYSGNNATSTVNGLTFKSGWGGYNIP